MSEQVRRGRHRLPVGRHRPGPARRRIALVSGLVGCAGLAGLASPVAATAWEDDPQLVCDNAVAAFAAATSGSQGADPAAVHDTHAALLAACPTEAMRDQARQDVHASGTFRALHVAKLAHTPPRR